MSRGGFSLIELTLVLAIMAIAVAVLALKLDHPLRAARDKDVLESIASFDLVSRNQARNQDRPLRMLFDTYTGKISRIDEEQHDCGIALELPEPYQIQSLVLPTGPASGEKVVVTCSRLGYTPTYGLVLQDGGSHKSYLVIAGLSGQAVEMKDEKEFKETLAIVARADAH